MDRTNGLFYLIWVVGIKVGPKYNYIPSDFGTFEVPNDLVITWGS